MDENHPPSSSLKMYGMQLRGNIIVVKNPNQICLLLAGKLWAIFLKFLSQFPYLQNRDNSGTYLIALTRFQALYLEPYIILLVSLYAEEIEKCGLDESTYIKYLE